MPRERPTPQPLNAPSPPAILRLQDGRRLAFVESGDPNGSPLFTFHGTPGSRLDGWEHADLAALGIRQISTDRPGYGCSDPKPGRSLVDWADDVRQLADALSIGEFAVFGGSGGAPHALACAAALDDRVTAVTLLSPGGPYFEHPELAVEADHFTRLIRRAAVDADLAWKDHLASTSMAAARLLADPEGELLARLAAMSPGERTVTERFVIGHAEKVRDMLRQGAAGWAWDFFIVVARPWGFAVEEINTPVKIWSGANDRVTATAAQWLATHLATVTYHEISDGFHALDLSASDVLATVSADGQGDAGADGAPWDATAAAELGAATCNATSFCR